MGLLPTGLLRQVFDILLQLDFLSIFLYSIYPKYVNKERGGSDFKCITFYLLLVQHENSKYMSFWQELHRVNKTVNLFWLLYGQMKNNFNYVYQEVLEKTKSPFFLPFMPHHASYPYQRASWYRSLNMGQDEGTCRV